MIRRRLFAYAVMMAAGITSGFLIAEKGMVLNSTILMFSVGISVFIIFQKSYSGTVESKKHDKDFALILMFLASGFLIFISVFISFESDCSITGKLSEEGTELVGRVNSVSRKGEGYRIEIDDVDITERSEQITLNHKVLASYYHDIDDIPAMLGSKIVLHGELSKPSDEDNPGCFNYRIYLRSKGISLVFRVNSYELINEKEKLPLKVKIKWKRYIYSARERFLNSFENIEMKGFLRGVIFGDKNEIDEDTRRDFDLNATGHILAVSGLHVGFLYSLLRIISGKRKTIPYTAFTIILIIAYGEMTVWSASTVRAMTVLSMGALSAYAKRPFDLLTSLSASCLMLLTIQPYQLFNTGFQMTFLALLGIAFITPPLKGIIGEYLAVIISVQLAIAPITAFIFHRLNILSILINIPVIAISSLLVPLCILMLYLQISTGSLPHFCITVITAVAEMLLKLNRILAGDGSFSSLIASSSPGFLVLFYLLVFFVSSEWIRIRLLRKDFRIMIYAFICILSVSTVIYFADYNRFADDEIVFVAVGQGDCTHIRANEKNILIDGGGQIEYNVGEKILMPYLLGNNADRVDLALVTHLHTDHCLGILQLEEEYPVDAIEIPSDYQKSIEKLKETKSDQNYKDEDSNSDSIEAALKNCNKLMYISMGQILRITDDVFIDPVWPIPDRHKKFSLDDPNENNMVYIINYRGIKIMVTGDLLEEDEIKMVEYYKNTDILDCDILKVAHHGSKSSSSEVFLDAVSPIIAVIQVGRNNFYGHPHQQTLDRLEERCIQTYRTDINGAVGIDIKTSKRIKVDLVNE